jgi:hypothetical protein
MLREQVEQLRQQYTDKYVAVDTARPELARFKGAIGQVKTVNMSGRALVQFEANNDRGWYDIAVEDLKVVDKPPPKPVEKKAPAAKPKAPPAKTPEKPTGEGSPG